MNRLDQVICNIYILKRESGGNIYCNWQAEGRFPVY